MVPDSKADIPMWPVVAASMWGGIVLLLAWTTADNPRLWSYAQLAVPFVVALVGLLTDSRRWRFLALWIAGWGSSLLAALFLTSGIGLLVLPVTAVYLWTAWRWNQARRSSKQTPDG